MTLGGHREGHRDSVPPTFETLGLESYHFLELLGPTGIQNVLKCRFLL